MSETSQELTVSRRGSHCLNCNTKLRNEAYCPECGQENTDRNISIWTLTQDFLGDYFSFDSKFFTTLIPLFFRPGRVPKEFMEGHRVKHIPPFRILIFSSFILFSIWGLTFNPGEDDPRTMSSILREDLILQQDSVQHLSDSLNVDLEELIVLDDSDLSFNLELDDDSTLNLGDKFKAFLNALDQGEDLQSAVDSIAIDNDPLEKKVLFQIGKMYTSDQGTIVKYFIGNLSLMILIIQPFFALLLKLIYIRRRKIWKFIAHLVFSFYFHAWVLVVLTLGILIKQFWTDINLAALVAIASAIYLLLAVKQFYGQTWAKSILKVIVLIFLYVGLIIPIFSSLSFMTSFYFF